MSPDPESEGPPLALDELARTALALSAERELGAMIARFTECVRAWAAPSALVAAARGAEAGAWRVLPALSFGSLPLGIERALQHLVEDLPQCLERPTVQQPIESVPGVKVRDNWIVPWWSEGESGLLLLRGVPRPYPQNLGAALALVSAPVWPRVLGGPATRVQSLVEQLQQMSGQLQVETARELQRLQAAAAAAAVAAEIPAAEPPPPAVAAEAPAADPALVGRLEAELRTTTEQLQAARDEAARLRDELTTLQAEAAGLRDETATLRDEAATLRDQAGRRAEEAARLADEHAGLAQQHARLTEEHAALAERLHSFEEQRGSMRGAEARARAAEEALAAAQEAIASHAGALRSERAAAVERVEAHSRVLEQAEQRALEAEQALGAARRELQARSELLEAERAAVERAEEQRRAGEASEARARAAGEALGAQAADAQRELAALRDEAGSLRGQLAAADQGRGAAEQALAGTQAAHGTFQAELATARAETDAVRSDLAAVQARISAEQERGRTAGEALAVVRTALVSLNRSAFVPSGLRFALEDVSAALQADAPARATGTRIVILDRDLGGLESLATELESAGVDVRIANYPEELALLLRTPSARELVAAICDVMAFRPDQNIAGLFRSWEKERPGLAFFLSYDAESSVEMERARRVPLSLTAAHMPRPLPAKRVAEAIESLARRQARS